MDVMVIGAIIVFVLLPIFSSIMERYILFTKSQIIKDAMDVTNLSVYYALETETLGKGYVGFNEDDVLGIYVKMLAKNLQLDADLNPTENSVVDYKVRIESVIIYTEDLPTTCPDGVNITRPAVHSCIVVPVKPVFFSNIITRITGKEYIELKVHVDSDIPINN
ncbi:MAG: hypothetical protein HPY74_07415 [Firmicutes bacterium]|nr:hypothetical protein [Bacillota bacterium]